MGEGSGKNLKIKKVASNTVLLFSARVIDSVLRLGSMAFIARILGTADFGRYALVVNITYFLGSLVALGTGPILVREAAKNPLKTNAYLSEILGVRIFSSTFMLAGILILTTLCPFSDIVAQGLVYMTVAHILFFTAGTFESVFISKEKMHYALWVTLVTQSIVFGMVVFIYNAKLSYVYIYLSFITGYLLQLILSAVLCRYFMGIGLGPGSLAHLRFFIQESVPMFFSQVIRQLSIRINVILIQFLASSTAVGIFHGPHRLVQNLQAVPESLTLSLLPQLSKIAETSKENLITYFHLFFKFFLALSLAAAVLSTIWSEQIIIMLFSDTFVAGVPCFKVLLWSMPALFLNALLMVFLITIKRQKVIMKGNFYGLVLNILLNLVLIPGYESLGASYAILISSVFAVSVMLYGLGPEFATKAMYSGAAKILAAAGISMVFPLVLIPENPFISSVASIFVYVLLLLLFGVMKFREIISFLNLLKNRGGRLPGRGGSLNEKPKEIR